MVHLVFINKASTKPDHCFVVARYLGSSGGMTMNTYGSMMPGTGMDGVQKSLIPSAQRRKRRVLFSQAQVSFVLELV